MRSFILAGKTIVGKPSSGFLPPSPIQPLSGFGPSFFTFSPDHDFCPSPNPGQTSTFILRPTPVLQASEKRTSYLPVKKNGHLPTLLAKTPSNQIPIGLFSRLIHLLSLRAPSPACSIYDIDTSEFPEDFGLDPFRGAAQDFHRPILMFGMATSAARINEALPLWKDWMSRGSKDIELNAHPSALILVPAEDAPDQLEQARAQLRRSQLNFELEAIHTPRYERRYFALVRWLWYTTKDRSGADEVDWYVFCDDDTYFLDIRSARHGIPKILNNFQSPKSVPYLVGSMSESSDQIRKYGEIAYGGAGIFVSRELMRMMNSPGQWEACDEEFSELYGGVHDCLKFIVQSNHDDRVIVFLTAYITPFND